MASNTELPTVANVIEAWEASGQLFTRALKAFQAKQLADTNDDLDVIDAAIAPQSAAHRDAISLDRLSPGPPGGRSGRPPGRWGDRARLAGSLLGGA